MDKEYLEECKRMKIVPTRMKFEDYFIVDKGGKIEK
jgi:hypothetical protein